MTSIDLDTLTPGQRDALAELLKRVAWSVKHSRQAVELYPDERSAQCAHEAACWAWVGEEYRRLTAG